jgi:hypothetical protein
VPTTPNLPTALPRPVAPYEHTTSW